jgi:yersiniabactin nonribosomal peptide synthetase
VRSDTDRRSPIGGADAGERLTLEAMRSAVAEALDDPASAIADDDDLVALGIDSMRTMLLANRWRRSGVDVTFAELIERPTLRDWWALVDPRLDAAVPDRELSPVDEGAPFELAPMQLAYWIGREDDRPLGGVGAHFYAEFDGAGVEAGRLERAVRALVARHGMLRARFRGGRQQILPTDPWRGLTTHDLREPPLDSAEQALLQLRARLSHRRLEIERGEVFDVQLSLLPEGATRVHVNIDMLVCDAHGFQIVLDDLARLYLEPARPPASLELSFAGYLATRAARQDGGWERAREYWRERVDEMPGVPQLPLALEPERLSRHRVGRHHHWTPPIERRQLEEAASANRLTLPILLLTAFAEVLATWSAEPRFLLTLPLFDREELHPDVPLLVGDFTNLIVLAVDASGDATFVERARSLGARLTEDVAHAAYSGVDVLRDVARSRGGDWLIAPVVFTSAIGIGDLFGDDVRRVLGKPGWTTSQTPQVWLDHQVTERDGGLLFNWDVVDELFPGGVVDAMFEAFVGLLEWLRAPGRDLATRLPRLLPASQASVRARADATYRAPPARPLHGAFFELAGQRPDARALAWSEDEGMTYGALAERALRVAGLLRAHGVGAGGAAAVTMRPGPERIVAVLGVLAAGAAYVPVAPDQPVHRRRRIYENARARVVVTGVAELHSLDWPGDVTPVTVEDAAALPPLAEPVPTAGEALAYVIYTSGSTGTPKGVEVSHRAATNTILDVNERFGVGPGDRVLAVSSLDFDLSVYDVFGLLSAGGAVVLVSEDAQREARDWVDAIARFGVTVWNSVPTLLDMLLTAASGDGLGSTLRLALVSGDRIGLDLPARLRAAYPGCRFVALGGATEAAIWSNALAVDEVPDHWRSIPYGRPLGNQRYRVVDARGGDCPDWVPGELWIGGLGVADGYRADPEQTADRFVERDGERWYRTGDLGRYWPDGTLEFLGRADRQVKVRGHRVELGEVEAVLEAHPRVARAAATTVGGRAPRLAAAVTDSSGFLDVSDVRSFAAARLPAYMVPTHVLALDDLPLNANEKVDRRELAELIEREAAAEQDEPPRGPIEAGVAELWAELLGVERVPRGQSFFALGGDSLLATRLLEDLRGRFGVELSLRRLFDAPTVAELAALIAPQRPMPVSEAVEEGVI